MPNLYFAYFYKPSSLTTDGWKDRLTCICDERGRIESQRDYDFITDNKFIYIGHYKYGTEPLNIWVKARA